MKVLITGINGFVGNFVFKNWSPSDEVYGVSSSLKTDLQSKNKIININDLNIVPDIDVVIMGHASVSSGNYCANTYDLFDANVLFTKKIADLFSKSYQIFISSASIYQNSNKKITEQSVNSPNNEYAISKYWGEKILNQSSAILRLSSLYGVNMRDGTIIPNYVNQAINNNRINVWGDGSRIQNYIHITDVFNYIQALALKKIPGVFLGVYTKEYSNIELAETIKGYTDCDINFVNSDNSKSVTYDNSYTNDQLNYIPEISLSKGIEQYILWKQK